MKRKIKNLYHYCSLDVFLKIIKNKTIRFSDIMRSNDREEILLLFNQYVESQIEKHKENNLAIKMFVGEIKKAIFSKTCFCFCLSEKRDLLSQWRGYAPNGGVCIGFKKQELENWYKKISILQGKTTLDKVTYIDKEGMKNKKLFKNCKDNILVNNYEALLKNAPKFKNKGFQEEKEWRMYFLGFRIAEEGNPLPCVQVNGESIKIGFMLYGNNQIKAYYDVPFELNMIREIIIGPKTDISVEELKTIISEYGGNIDINVEQTKLTLR